MEINERKKVLKNLSYGLFVLTTKHEGAIYGATLTWVSQISINPCKIMLGINKTSQIYDILSKSRYGTINIIGESQKKMAQTFLKLIVSQDNSLAGYKSSNSPTNSGVILDGVSSIIDFKVSDIYENDMDHAAFICEVLGAKYLNDDKPLSLQATGWSYGG